MKTAPDYPRKGIARGCATDVRFWSHVDMMPNDGCWEWGGRLYRGYGHFWLNGKQVLVHRYLIERDFGPIPKGMHLMHKCDNRKCVRPEHLRIGTPLENVRDCHTKGRHPDNQHSKKTHCHRGHPFSPENTNNYEWRGIHYRRCRKCSVIESRARRVKWAS